MFAWAGPLLTNAITSAQQFIVPGIIAIALLIGGATWALGNHKDGKSAVVAALIGGAVMLAAVTIASAIRGAVGGAPA